MSKLKSIASVALCGSLAACGTIALSGCNAVESIKGAVGNTSIGQTIMSSKNTTMSDRKDCYKVIEDIDGTKYVSVIYVDAKEGNAVGNDVLENVLTSNNINWYQYISANSMGSGQKEYALVFMPASVNLDDMRAVADIINRSNALNARVALEEEYLNYVASQPEDGIQNGIKLYGKETTHYGPASQTQQSDGQQQQ